MSGFGRSSQWYRNVLATDPVEVCIARLRFAPQVRPRDGILLTARVAPRLGGARVRAHGIEPVSRFWRGRGCVSSVKEWEHVGHEAGGGVALAMCFKLRRRVTRLLERHR